MGFARSLRRLLPTAARAICAAAIGAIGWAQAAQAQDPFATWEAWLTSLQSQGYTVTQGAALDYTQQFCTTYDRPVFNYCFGDNLSEPYILLQPPVNTEYTDPYYGAAGVQITPSGTPVSRPYRLATTDALLVVINLPPQAAYLSYQSYLFTRPTSLYTHPLQNLSPDPQRGLLFATFNNSINNIAIQRQSGLSWGQGTVAMVTTSNSALANTLVGSYQAFGGSANQMFIDAMGNNLNPGIDQNADEFMGVIRYSVPSDPVAGGSWRSNAVGNVLVYRISAPAQQSVRPYGATPLYVKYINTAEASHQSAVNEMTKLLQGWLAGQEGHPVTVGVTKSSEQVGTHGTIISGLGGPICIAGGTDCKGDQQDTDAYKTLKIGALPATGMFIVDGVEHDVTNNATYTNVGIDDTYLGARVASASQTNPAAAGFTSGVLTGSAAQALTDLGLISQASPTLMADLPNLYVTIFVRSCDQAQAWCTRGYTITLPSSISTTDKLEVAERAYVLPGYLNGAQPGKLLNPQVIY